jgi:N-acetylneuraminic acid mutarotase
MKALHLLAAGLQAAVSILARRVSFPLLCLGAGLVFLQSSAGTLFAFDTTGSLATGRIDHTATLLPNGKVLVAGGFNSTSGYLSSAELYDPASGTWSATGSLIIPRYRHTATLLSNGKVLVAGGYNGGSTIYLTSAELYDPASGTWTATGSLGEGRYQHTATLLPNGKVLVAGGHGFTCCTGSSGVLATTELYDPASGTWTSSGNLATDRAEHTATLLANGKVLVAGGNNPKTGYPANAELYDPTSGMWTPAGSLSTSRNFHTATLLTNGKVLVVGGFYSPCCVGGGALASAELFDPANNTWTTTGTLATARSDHTATLLPNGRVFVAGGAPASAEVYDTAGASWATDGSLATARSKHTATLLPNGKVLIAGGSDGTNSLASAELYPPEGALANMSTRLDVGTSENVLIAGFVIQGSAPKKVLIRGIGPSLTQFGITNALSNPQLELHDSTSTIALNDNWQTTQVGGAITDDQAQEIQDSGLAPAHAAESAIIATLAPGNYTAIVRGVGNTTGVGSAQVYDLGPGGQARLANMSARGLVQQGDQVMIGGMIIINQPTTVVIRAIGPSLHQSGVSNALENPQLELHDATSTIATNDDWQTTQIGGVITSDQTQELLDSHLAPNDPAESAMIVTLQPGSYTAVVKGVNSTSGIGLVEIYALE